MTPKGYDYMDELTWKWRTGMWPADYAEELTKGMDDATPRVTWHRDTEHYGAYVDNDKRMWLARNGLNSRKWWIHKLNADGTVGRIVGYGNTLRDAKILGRIRILTEAAVA